MKENAFIWVLRVENGYWRLGPSCVPIVFFATTELFFDLEGVETMLSDEEKEYWGRRATELDTELLGILRLW